MTTAPLIELKNVSQKFDSQSLLQNVQFQVNKGEKFVLIGPSGHGKTVLLKIMAGILTPSEGEVLVEGQSLLTLRGKEREKLQRSMGMLFQKNALFDSMTVYDNIAFPLRETTNLSEEKIQKRVQYFLYAVGLPDAGKLFPEEISGGMQKRVGIARALALYPQIIFYDDPTAGLDPITSRKIVDLINQLQQELGSTLVAITNDMNRAYQMADRIALVADRELIVTGSVEQTKACENPRVHKFIRGENHD